MNGINYTSKSHPCLGGINRLLKINEICDDCEGFFDEDCNFLEKTRGKISKTCLRVSAIIKRCDQVYVLEGRIVDKATNRYTRCFFRVSNEKTAMTFLKRCEVKKEFQNEKMDSYHWEFKHVIRGFS